MEYAIIQFGPETGEDNLMIYEKGFDLNQETLIISFIEEFKIAFLIQNHMWYYIVEGEILKNVHLQIVFKDSF